MSFESLKVLSLLFASLGFVLMEESVSGASPGIPSPSIPSPRIPSPVQRRYSEATLASDYSRTMDTMLKKNFVEWLLARREKKSEITAEQFRRDAEPRGPAQAGQGMDQRSQEAKDFLSWILKATGNQSFTPLADWEGLEGIPSQELLAWLASVGLCRPATA